MKSLSFVLVIFLFLVFLLGCLSASPYSSIPKVCFGERCVIVEVASTSEERAQGLMYRQALSGNAGVLFVFEKEDIYGFWMKNTLIPLDAIWMDAQGKVVDIQTMLPCEKDPCKVYIPSGNAQYVLEFNPGVARQWGIIPGDVAQISGV